jgi:alpha-galactosidase
MRNSFKFITVLMIVGIVAGIRNLSVANENKSTVWLDELDISKCKSNSVPAQTNKSASGKPLIIAGKQFEHGVGIMTPSRFVIKLANGATRFTASVGIDDSIVDIDKSRPQYYTGTANLSFILVGDNEKVLWSNKLRYGQLVQVDIGLADVNEITLVVETDSSFPFPLYADWVDAKFEVQACMPKAVEIKSQKPYILTPKSSMKPQINGADVFGVRPQNPFLYRIAATGQRPMTFSIVGLPDGLSLDNQTGIITGKINEAGSYKMTITAKNSLGKASREFTVVVGDQICPTPPMGWNSWNCWACSVDDQKVRQAADVMVKSGLANHGWTYINIDDCWPGKRDQNTGEISSNEKFPDMKSLTDYVHSLGLKIGLYTDCGPNTCAKFEGSEGHEEQDIMTYAKWGFDYIKIDWCGCEGKDGPMTYSKFGPAIAKADRDIVFSICEWGLSQPWLWGPNVGGNCWRTTGDVTDTWPSIVGIGFSQGGLSQYAGPGHWNDPDMLVVGNIGWGDNLHPTRLTPDEQYIHISLWSLLSSPLLIGCDMNSLDDFTYSLLANDEVIAVNQDSLGRQAKQIRSGDEQIWVKDLKDGSKAVGVFNLTTKAKAISFSLADIGLSGKCKVRDLWRQKNMGVIKKDFMAKVPAHGVVLVKVSAK